MSIDKSQSSSSSLFPRPTRQPQQNVTSFSPYLNYDPRLLQQAQPEFIFPEGASKQRGRFELAFSQIGSAVMVHCDCRRKKSTVLTLIYDIFYIR